MRGRFHVNASISYLFALAWSVYSAGLPYEMFSILLLAVAIGSLLPDVDASDSAILRETSGTGQFLKYAVYYPAAYLAEKFLRVEKRHRGIMHSLAGILLFDLVLLPILYFLTMLYTLLTTTAISDFSIVLPLLIVIGLTVGALFHLIEDSFTVSGVQWLLPRKRVVRGNIRTFSKQEEKVSELLFVTGLAPLLVSYYVRDLWMVVVTTVLIFTCAYIGQRLLIHKHS